MTENKSQQIFSERELKIITGLSDSVINKIKLETSEQIYKEIATLLENLQDDFFINTPRGYAIDPQMLEDFIARLKQGLPPDETPSNSKER